MCFQLQKNCLYELLICVFLQDVFSIYCVPWPDLIIFCHTEDIKALESQHLTLLCTNLSNFMKNSRHTFKTLAAHSLARNSNFSKYAMMKVQKLQMLASKF